jgi:hypothetical protein
MLRRFDGQLIPGALSTGSGRVFAAEDWRQLILGSAEGDIRCKAEKGSRWRSSFSKEDRPRLTAKLGFYSDVQSINSEDTVTWSVFQQSGRSPWLSALLSRVFADANASEWSLGFWKRTEHPDDPQNQYGPEADLLIEAPERRFVIESKWLTDIGNKQGKMRDKTQLEMRKFQCGKIAKSGVLLIAPSSSKYPPSRDPNSVFSGYFALDGGKYKPLQSATDLGVRIITWEDVADVLLANGELLRHRYLNWRLDLISCPDSYLSS